MILYSAISKTGEVAPRTGFFHFFKSKEILVHSWDENAEDIYNLEEKDPDQVERYRADLQGLDRFLGGYPYDQTFQIWNSLSNNITLELLQKLTPSNGKMSSVSNVVYLEKDLPEFMSTKSIPEHAIKFQKIDLKKSFPKGATPQEITKYSMDKSYLLEQFLNQYEKGIFFFFLIDFNRLTN